MSIQGSKINPVLNGVVRKFLAAPQQGLVAVRLAPRFPTAIQAAQYYVFSKANALNVPRDIRRAPGGIHAELPATVLSDETYRCINYGIKGGVPDELRAFYASSFDADRVKVEQAAHVQLIKQEIRVKEVATGAGVPTSAAGTKWDNALSKPRADIIMMKAAINANSVGFEANTMVISREVADVLIEHPDVKANVIQVTGGNITYEQLRIYFGIENLAIAGAFDNSAADGQAAVASRIWGDSVVLGYVDPSASRNFEAPTFIRSFEWTGVTPMESYRDVDRKTDFHTSDLYLDEKLAGGDLGYHLSDVLS